MPLGDVLDLIENLFVPSLIENLLLVPVTRYRKCDSNEPSDIVADIV